MLHNDCDGGACVACHMAEQRAKGRRCDTCYWWLRDWMGDGEGICRRYRPARVETTGAGHFCREHSFDQPLPN
ncbi:hypothetical protein CLV77_1433 [Brevirhabdus pacifica]|nr:hypothetical protein CLV77_1433 [Brevirhabdus pacifica]